jgi:hypothetical protein
MLALVEGARADGLWAEVRLTLEGTLVHWEGCLECPGLAYDGYLGFVSVGLKSVTEGARSGFVRDGSVYLGESVIFSFLFYLLYSWVELRSELPPYLFCR